MNLSSSRDPEQRPYLAGDSVTSPEKMMALSINSHKNSLNDFAIQSLSKISNGAQRVNEESPQMMQSQPGVLMQSPSFGCLVRKQNIEIEMMSPLKSPQQPVKKESFNGLHDSPSKYQQNNIFFNRNLSDQDGNRFQIVKKNSSQHMSQPLEEQVKFQVLSQKAKANYTLEQNLQGSRQSLNYSSQPQISQQQNNQDISFEESKSNQIPLVQSDGSSSRNSQVQGQNSSLGVQRINRPDSQTFIASQSMNQLQESQILHQVIQAGAQSQNGIPIGTITTVNLNNYINGQTESQIHHQYNVPLPLVTYQQQPIVQNQAFVYGGGRQYIESFVQVHQPSEIFNPVHPFLMVQNQNIQQNPPQVNQQLHSSLNSMFQGGLVQRLAALNDLAQHRNVGQPATLSQQVSVNQNQSSQNQRQHDRVVETADEAFFLRHIEREPDPVQQNFRPFQFQLGDHPAIFQARDQIEEIKDDQYLVERVEEEQQISDPQLSDLSEISSIPSEHEEGLNYNEYIRRYALKLVTMTWNRDSHGLFDFEMRQLKRQNFEILDEKNFVREAEECKILDPQINVRTKFGKRSQLLMSIKKQRNRFMLETPVKYMLKNAITPEEIKQIQERDVECFYSDIGEQTLPPYDMCERLYLVVRSIINEKNEHQDYELKKGDIIKVGRQKFYVREINIKSKIKKLKQKTAKILRLRKGYVDNIMNQRRSVSANPMQNDEGNSRQVGRLPLHRDTLVAGQQRVRLRTAAPSFQETEQNEGQRIYQQQMSNGEVTQITDNLSPRLIDEDEIKFPPNLALKRNDSSSDASNQLEEIKGNQQDIEQRANFKKMVKRYANLEMAPLEGGPIAEEPLEPEPKIQSTKDKQDSQKPKDEVDQNSSQAYCRFCWGNDHNNVNPLISSCNCSGGVRFVHFQCLKTWIKTKMISQNQARIQMFFWKNFECEICKTVFPTRFKTQNGIKYSLFDLDLDNSKDYLMLEGINSDRSTSKLIYLLLPGDGIPHNTYKVGRANDQDVRINDISVSRQHATIEFKNERFTIKDNLSKFGTLIQIQNQLEIKPKQTRILQVGRTIMNVSLRPIKQKEKHDSKILWQDPLWAEQNKKSQEPIQQVKKDTVTKITVQNITNRIQNNQQYIQHQANLHRRIIDNYQFENQGYSIERRQLNLNLDDFYKNLAQDEQDDSENDFQNESPSRQNIEEYKGQMHEFAPRVVNHQSRHLREEGEEMKVNQLPGMSNLQPQTQNSPQRRVVPKRRHFVEMEQNQPRKQTEFSNERVQLPKNRFGSSRK